MSPITLLDAQLLRQDIEVKEGESVDINLALLSDFVPGEININVGKSARVNAALADFSVGSGKFKVTVNLEEGASLEWNLSSFSRNQDKKEFDVSCIHLGRKSQGQVSNYGLAKDSSKLVFSGVSKIERGCKESSTRQEAKIIVFGKEADGKCFPILKIDENDVSASHGATVGRMNDDHLFYMLSRGLPEKEARKLITLGYLTPILSHLTDEGLKKKVESRIEEAL